MHGDISKINRSMIICKDNKMVIVKKHEQSHIKITYETYIKF